MNAPIDNTMTVTSISISEKPRDLFKDKVCPGIEFIANHLSGTYRVRGNIVWATGATDDNLAPGFTGTVVTKIKGISRSTIEETGRTIFDAGVGRRIGYRDRGLDRLVDA